MIKKLVFCLTILVSSTSCAKQAPVWHMVNCNTTSQGDCHLLEDNGMYTLIDAGQPHIADRALVPYLKARRISVIEHFFVSHPHTDHYGGLTSLIKAGVKVKNVYYNAPPAGVSDSDFKPGAFQWVLNSARNRGAILHNIDAGFKVELPNSILTVLEAKKERQAGGVNDYSLIMTWDAGGYRTLFTGDLNRRLGQELAGIEKYRADILKVPHHGVTGIAPNEFFDNVGPSLIMVPAHKGLWFHPRGKQVKTWAEKNWAQRKTYVCNNGFNGDVRISFFKNHLGLDPQIPNTTCPKKNWYLTPKKKVSLIDKMASNSMAVIINLLLD